MTSRGTVSRARAFTDAQGRSDQGGRYDGQAAPMAKRLSGHVASCVLEQLDDAPGHSLSHNGEICG